MTIHHQLSIDEAGRPPVAARAAALTRGARRAAVTARSALHALDDLVGSVDALLAPSVPQASVTFLYVLAR